MSTAPVVTSELPALSVALPLLLRSLAGSTPDEGRLAIAGRTPQGVGQTQLLVSTRSIEDGWIPAPVLERLEADFWFLQVGLAVRDPDAAGHVCALHALAAAWACPRVYRNERGEDGGSGSHHVWPTEKLQAAVAAAEGFSLPPTMLLRAAGTVTAVWALSSPIDVRGPAGQADALSRLRRLASVLGADLLGDDVALQDVVIGVPGSRTREPEGDVVVALGADSSCVYDLAQIDAALAAPSSSPSRSSRPTRAATRPASSTGAPHHG